MAAQSRVFQSVCDVKDVVAFRDDHVVNVNVAAHQPVIYVAQSRRVVEFILARLQRFVAVRVMPEQERVLAVYDSRLLQFRGNMPRGRTGLELDKLLLVRSCRQQQPTGEQRCRYYRADYNQSEKESDHG